METAPQMPRDTGTFSKRPHHHVAQFYESDEFLFDSVTGFLAAGLKTGQPVVVFARPETRKAFAGRLARSGVDYEAACRSGDLLVHDARASLATFMRGSLVDKDRFNTRIGGIIADGLRGRAPLTARAYGEMVDVLFRDGNVGAAIRLEELWNELAEKHSFELLCAYSINNFYTPGHAEQLKEICRQHSHVLPTESYALLSSDQDRARKVIELQQRERTLLAEIEHRKAIELALRDVLAERQSAKELAERANRAKTEFLAVMSHELRTPLTAIMGYEELMEHGVGGPVSEQQRVFLHGIRTGASHLLRLIDQILMQSRLAVGKETVELATVDFGQLVNTCAELVQPAADERGLALNVRAPERVICQSDEGKVEQILLNLLTNAVKFTVSGHIDVTLWMADGQVCVDVRDTGIGFAPADAERIFEAFEQADSTHTRASNGAGLGLSVSRSLARLLGGDVTAKSTLGVGSTFSLRLPLREAV